MKRKISSAILILFLSLPAIFAGKPTSVSQASRESDVRITIIYDNYQANNKLKTDWGFACMVEIDEHKLLFDAGNNRSLYRENLQFLSIDPAKIPSLFISHEHNDHTAGMPWITQLNPSITCYLPASYASALKAKNRLPKNSTPIENPMHLYGPFYSTGDSFEAFREQGLVVKTGEGGILITGCSHPGIVEMVKKAEEAFDIEINTVIGGLHLMRKNDQQLESISDNLKNLGVTKICPTHCTGDHSIAYLKRVFGDGYINGGTGRVITIQKPG